MVSRRHTARAVRATVPRSWQCPQTTPDDPREGPLTGPGQLLKFDPESRGSERYRDLLDAPLWRLRQRERLLQSQQLPMIQRPPMVMLLFRQPFPTQSPVTVKFRSACHMLFRAASCTTGVHCLTSCRRGDGGPPHVALCIAAAQWHTLIATELSPRQNGQSPTATPVDEPGSLRRGLHLADTAPRHPQLYSPYTPFRLGRRAPDFNRVPIADLPDGLGGVE